MLRVCENPDCSLEFAVEFVKCPACGTPRTDHRSGPNSAASTPEDSASKAGWGNFFLTIAEVVAIIACIIVVSRTILVILAFFSLRAEQYIATIFTSLPHKMTVSEGLTLIAYGILEFCMFAAFAVICHRVKTIRRTE